MMGAREGARETWEMEGWDGEGRHEGLDVNFSDRLKSPLS